MKDPDSKKKGNEKLREEPGITSVFYLLSVPHVYIHCIPRMHTAHIYQKIEDFYSSSLLKSLNLEGLVGRGLF